MAEYRNDELGVAFTVPDRPTVRQVLAYDGALEFSRDNASWVRFWLAACEIGQTWQCETVALSADVLDSELTDPRQVQVIKWAGLAAFGHMQALKDVPKNS